MGGGGGNTVQQQENAVPGSVRKQLVLRNERAATGWDRWWWEVTASC